MIDLGTSSSHLKTMIMMMMMMKLIKDPTKNFSPNDKKKKGRDKGSPCLSPLVEWKKPCLALLMIIEYQL